MEQFIEFFSFKYPNIKYVLFGSILLAISAALVGCFTFLKKKSLIGDAVAHSILPGVCLSFMLAGTKNPLLLVVGAFCTGWISILLMDYITSKTKLKEDSAIGLTLSVFFGFGILLLTIIQHSGNAAQSGLDAFLFGKAASLVGQDLIVFSVIAIILIAVIFLFFKGFTLISFDEAFASSIGFPVKKLELLLTSLTVLAVVIGIQAVGVVLMAAMLITPAAASRFWTDNLKYFMIIAASFGVISGITGAYISFIAPSMPTGPWIVMILSIIAILSFLLSPKKGIVFKAIKQYRIKKKYLEENILKAFYQIEERKEDEYLKIQPEDILRMRNFPEKKLLKGLKALSYQGFIEQVNAKWKLTPEGRSKGKRIVKLHRLWETYLTKYVRIAPDHVHEDAESIEHILTPELEQSLERILQYPQEDPHKSTIPY